MPEIGVEPTRREALAPETSVSTISPLGLAKVGQRYKNLLIYELFFDLYHDLIPIFLVPPIDGQRHVCEGKINVYDYVVKVRNRPIVAA